MRIFTKQPFSFFIMAILILLHLTHSLVVDCAHTHYLMVILLISMVMNGEENYTMEMGEDKKTWKLEMICKMDPMFVVLF